MHFLDDRTDKPKQHAVTRPLPARTALWRSAAGRVAAGGCGHRKAGDVQGERRFSTAAAPSLGRKDAVHMNPLAPGDSNGTTRVHFLKHKRGVPD